jgi:hypothetical protein
MSHDAEHYDIFLCFPYEGRGLGDMVTMGLEEAGFRVFRPTAADVARAAGRSPDPRDVLAGSRAVVGVALSGDVVDPTLVVAIGAARALGKPVFIVTDEVERPDLPSYMASLHVFPQSRLDHVVDAVRRIPAEGGHRRQRRVG